MRISLENIGGITRRTEFELKEGINIIKSPNAIGKTSFIHGIQSMILPDSELKRHTEFLNDFNKHGKVELIHKDKKWIKDLREGTMGLTVYGDTFYPDGLKASLLSIAIPENEFLDTVLKGRSLDIFFEEFADVKSIQKLVEWSEDKHYDLSAELNRQLADITELKTLRSSLEITKKELEKNLRRKEELEPIYQSIKRERWDELADKLGEKRDERSVVYVRITDLNNKINTTQGIIDSLEREIGDLENELKNFQKAHPNIDREIDRFWDDIVELKTNRDNIQSELDLKENQYRATETFEPMANRCQTCGKKYTILERRKRLSKLKNEINELRKELIRIKAKIEESETERNSLIEDRRRILTDYNIQIKQKNNYLSKLESSVRDWKSEFEKKQEQLKVIVQEISELEKSVDPKTKKIIQQYSECLIEIETTKNKITMFEDMIMSKSEAEKNTERLQRQTRFLKRGIIYLKERKNQIKNLAREKFNKRIMEVYNILGFRDFQNIEIDEMFRVKVRRVKEERVITQDLNRLSTSERLTIGVLVMLAGKEEYLPDFPFFILDEITTAYDPVRFEKIIKYIQKVVPYVIVTTLTPSGDLKVEHKF